MKKVKFPHGNYSEIGQKKEICNCERNNHCCNKIFLAIGLERDEKQMEIV